MNNTKANGLQNANFLIISVPGLICAIEIRKTALYSLEGHLESNYSKETARKNNSSDLKSMNNTKANGLRNAHFSIISLPGRICAIKIRETALYSLEGLFESN